LDRPLDKGWQPGKTGTKFIQGGVSLEHIETIRIGDFRLTRTATGVIWIEIGGDGEGGGFGEEKLEVAIAKFYADNF